MPRTIRSNHAPTSDRPFMPGYDMMFEKNRKSIPWGWAVNKLSDSHNYLLMSIWSGKPHAMPVWGVWVRDSFFFSTGASSRKSKNLQANPHCLVCPDGATDALILHGVAEICSDK